MSNSNILNEQNKQDLTKRELYNKALALITTIVIMVAILVFIFTYIVPNIKAIDETKKEAIERNTYYTNLLKSWLTYNDFSRVFWASLKDVKFEKTDAEYIKKVKPQITKEFYSDYFTNTSTKSYDDFMVLNKKEIFDKLSSPEYKKASDDFNNLLPYFVDYINPQDAKWKLSNTTFINYVERLFQQFNLKIDTPLWIESFLPYDSWEKSANPKEVVQSNIFYIPFTVNFSGKKSDIVKFVYYLQNVWKVKSVWDKDNGYSLKTDESTDAKSILSNNLWYWFNENNLLISQTISIEDVEFLDPLLNWNYKFNDELPDSITTDAKLVNAIINDDVEEYTAKVSFNFYVKWMPENMMLEEMLKTVELYESNIKGLTEILKKFENPGILARHPDLPLIRSTLSSYKTNLEKDKANTDIIKNLKAKPIWIKDIYAKSQDLKFKVNFVDKKLKEYKEIVESLIGK